MKKQIGVVGVDAGLLMVGDPCYFIRDTPEHKTAADVAELTWKKVCSDTVSLRNSDGQQLTFSPQNPGLGVIVNTTHGDGIYPVFLVTTPGGRRRSVVYLD